MSSGELATAAAGLQEAPPRRRDLRRRAFEANLSLALERRLKDKLSLKETGLLIQALGAAHSRTRHAIDARTTINFFGMKRYFVFQVGGLWGAAAPEHVDASPFAQRLINSIPEEARQAISRHVAEVLAAIDEAEITRRHPIDKRRRGAIGRFQYYVTLIGGPDRRSASNAVSNERRAPANETMGFFILFFIAALIATLGAVLIVATVAGLAGLLSEESGRNALMNMLTSIYAGDE